MALYYDVTLRGTVLNAVWATPFHVRLVSGFSGGTEAEVAQSIAEGLRSQYLTDVAPTLSTQCVLTKVVVQGYQEDTGFYELAAAISGGQNGSDAPTFNAFGFRQFRTNVLFRASKHAMPGVLLQNINEGSFQGFGDVNGTTLNLVSVYFSEQRSIVDDETVTGVIQPVLIRTQNTVTDPITGTKTTTYFDPHQISDVGAGAFYGLTSQVSRKVILGAG